MRQRLLSVRERSFFLTAQDNHKGLTAFVFGAFSAGGSPSPRPEKSSFKGSGERTLTTTLRASCRCPPARPRRTLRKMFYHFEQ